jgi:hypothetical protein
MTREEAHRQAEALAQGMGITFYVVRDSEDQYQPVHVVPEDCEIVATVAPPGSVESDSENAS